MSGKKVTNFITILHPSLRDKDRSKEFKDCEYLTSNNPESVVAATNELAEKASGEILMFVSDDLKLPKDWKEQLEKVVNPQRAEIYRPDDNLQKWSNTVITHPIMTRLAYDQLGYFFYPEYLSMWVDVDLWWISNSKHMRVDAHSLKWEHLHHSIGKSKNDEVYKRSEANWNQGAEVFNRRAIENGWSKRASYR